LPSILPMVTISKFGLSPDHIASSPFAEAVPSNSTVLRRPNPLYRA
jgi:hypothetical protein